MGTKVDVVEVLGVIGNALIIYSTAIAFSFVVLYHFKSTWWRSPTGKGIMALWAVITSVFILSTIRQFVETDTLFFAALRLTVFALVPVVLTWHFVLLVTAQREARRERQQNGKSGKTGAMES